MSDFLQVAPIGLSIWWAAQALLGVRDYLRRRRAVKSLPPPDGAELAALARVQAGRPAKEPSGLRWWLTHPTHALVDGTTGLLGLIFFWPLLALLFTLPKVPERLPADLVKRINAEHA